MSCLTGALVLVPRSPKGGYWVYNGYSTSAAGPFNMTPLNPVFPGYSSGQILYGGESDFLIYVKDKTNGFYSLSYYFESGSNTLKIQVIDDSLCVAQDQTITMSSTGSPVDLTTYLDDLSCASHETGGDWEDLDSSGALTGSSFDPQTAGAGTWRIRYYFNESGFTDACCDTEIILTIVVTADFSIDILTADTTDVLLDTYWFVRRTYVDRRTGRTRQVADTLFIPNVSRNELRNQAFNIIWNQQPKAAEAEYEMWLYTQFEPQLPRMNTILTATGAEGYLIQT